MPAICSASGIGASRPDFTSLLDVTAIPDAQLGHLEEYDHFLAELDRVWQRCFDVLSRVADSSVSLATSASHARRTTADTRSFPSDRALPSDRFDNLSPIIWNKIANVAHEVENGGEASVG
ncbi:MAG: hypothetical protein R3B90_13235 [Planctomycetaceae bacterium]